MKKTKVCFISHYTYKLFNEKSQITIGGNEVLFYLISKELVKDKKIEISFLVEDDTSKNKKIESINGIKLYKTSRDKSFQGKLIETRVLSAIFNRIAERFNKLWQLPHVDFFRLWEEMKAIRADVYIQGSASYEAGLTAILCKLFFKKFIFLVGHDEDIDKTYVNRNKILGKIYEFSLKKAHLVWCTSKRHQRMLKKHYQLDSIYIPYWYPTQKKILPFSKRKEILWIARLDKWKNPEGFINLAKRMPDVSFKMIMALSRNNPDYFKKVVDMTKSVKNMTIKTNVPFSKAIEEYKKAMLFVDTSDYGSMHTSHLMAAAHGTPSLTLFKDPNNSFKDFDWGFAANGRVKKLEQLVRKVIKDPKLWKNLSSQAVQFSQKIHNIDDKVSQFKKLVQS